MTPTPAPTEDRNAMSFGELVAWGWRETEPVHKNRTNLLIHLFAVPLFVVAHALVIAGLVAEPWLLAAAPVCLGVSMGLQRFGHSCERTPPIPFLNARDLVRRFYAEQFYNFGRYLFSGGWYAAFKTAKS